MTAADAGPPDALPVTVRPVTVRPVTVRHWAAARAAAGVAEEQVAAATLAELVERLSARHGPALARVLSYCSFVVDGSPATGRRERAGTIGGREEPPPLPAVDLPPGCVVEVLPPFAGGAGGAGGAAAPDTGRTGIGTGGLGAAGGAVLTAALLVGTDAWSRVALAVALVVVQVVLALVWTSRLGGGPGLLGLPVLSGLAADAVLLSDRSRAADGVIAVIGLAVLAALLQQLVRRHRERVTAQLAVVVSGVALVAVLSLLLPLRELPDGVAAVTALLVGAAAAVLVGRLPLPASLTRPAGLVAAALLGGLVGVGGGPLTVPWGAGVAAAAGLAASVADLVLLRAADEDAADDADAARTLPVLLSVLPVVAAVPLGYLVARVTLG